MVRVRAPVTSRTSCSICKSIFVQSEVVFVTEKNRCIDQETSKNRESIAKKRLYVITLASHVFVMGCIFIVA